MAAEILGATVEQAILLVTFRLQVLTGVFTNGECLRCAQSGAPRGLKISWATRNPILYATSNRDEPPVCAPWRLWRSKVGRSDL